MELYLTGALISLAAAIGLKRKALPQKQYHRALLILAAGFLLAAAAGALDDKDGRNHIARNEPCAF